MRVMVRKFAETGVKPDKGPVMAWKNKHVFGQGALKLAQGSKIKAQRVSMRVHRPNAHIGGNAFDDLIGRKEKAVFLAIEHGLLWRMAVADEDAKIATAKPQHIPATIR